MRMGSFFAFEIQAAGVAPDSLVRIAFRLVREIRHEIPAPRVVTEIAILPRQGARELLATITDQEALASSTGKLLAIYVNARSTPRKDVIAALTECTKDPEPAVAFDAMDALAGVAIADGDFEQAEKWFLEASALIPQSGQIRLGNFYFLRQDFDRALPVYLEVLQRDIAGVNASLEKNQKTLADLEVAYRKGETSEQQYREETAKLNAENAKLTQSNERLQGELTTVTSRLDKAEGEVRKLNDAFLSVVT